MTMPIRDIHTPTVAASANGTAATSTATLQQLIARKDALESELKALGSVLDSHGVHMRTTLTTFDGYPRADIDIAQIRTTRARIIYLRNDHKELLAKIEEGLHKHFAEEAAKPEEDVVMNGTNGIQSTEHVNGTNGLHTTNGVNGTDENTPNTPAFAIVNTVSPSSPAETAGLKSGDKIIQFGDVDWLNHEKLSKVAQVVGRNEGRTILVVVERDGQSAPLRISLVPRRDWGGRGTLGCHLKEL